MKRFLILLATLVFATPQSEAASKAPHIVNFVNFVRDVDYRIEDSAAKLLDATAKEIHLAEQYRFPTTFLLQYDALIDPSYQKLFMEHKSDNLELGAWWEITMPHANDAGLEWTPEHSWEPHSVLDFSIGWSRSDREKLVDTFMNKFKEVFGTYPRSIGSWYIDSYTIGYIHDKYGIDACCICKDQIGTDGYTLWGGYWNQAYYPSRKCLYMPAQTEVGQIDVPVFRMLGSDPIYQYIAGLGSSIQNVVSLEPVYKEGGGNPDWVNYFFDSMASQPCLAYSYAQTGQENSFTWNRIGPGLEIQAHFIDSLRSEGTIRIETLGASGCWFHNNFKLTPATAVTALKDFGENGHKAIWYNSRFYRARFFWTSDSFLIQDIHTFDENHISPFDENAALGREFKIMANTVVDGYTWSVQDDFAGLYIVLPDGSSYDFSEPKVIEKRRKGQLIVKNGKFRIICNEDCLTIKGRIKGWKAVIHNPALGTDREIPVKRGNLSIRVVAGEIKEH